VCACVCVRERKSVCARVCSCAHMCVHILCNTHTVFGQSVAKINGWDLAASISGHFVSFKPLHDWVYTPAGDFEWTKTSDGNREWCEYEQSCNHIPWDVSAETQEKCVDSYQPNGVQATQGASFCAQVREMCQK